MAVLPRDEMNVLLARDYYRVCDATGCYYSRWYHWQRWVVLGALLVFAAIVLVCCACFSARRRRRRGLSPFYGTAWTAPPPAYNVHNIPNNSTGPQYGGYTYASENNNNNATSPYNQPATSPYNPAGSPPPPGYTPANAGYYGQQQGTTGGGYEMNSFGGGSAPYVPPRPEQAHVSKH